MLMRSLFDLGYYPPNHHMVTGADSLDTYEALWCVSWVFDIFVRF